MQKEIIDRKSGWSLLDIEIFKKELKRDIKCAINNYGFSIEEVDYILNFKLENNIVAPFNDNYEQMFDFFDLSKEEFLESYSYINSESYDMTKNIIKNKILKDLRSDN